VPVDATGSATADPGTHLPDLASFLKNLSNQLSELGRHEEGLAAVEEATTLRRRLARADPDAHLPRLATSLTELSHLFADLGSHKRALTATAEAVAVRAAGAVCGSPSPGADISHSAE